VLAREDPDVLAAYDAMMRRVYLVRRRLDGRTKELVYCALLVALGAAEEHIRPHMEKAQQDGATAEDVLETIELLIPAPAWHTLPWGWRSGRVFRRA
jgi:alkylhydroperoxidase/carboxymuconolactone decarboxylase family protein YurZ